MIGTEEIRAAAESETSPQDGWYLDVDTEALAIFAMTIVGPHLAADDLHPVIVKYSAAWSQGFMAGVVAARREMEAAAS